MDAIDKGNHDLKSEKIVARIYHEPLDEYQKQLDAYYYNLKKNTVKISKLSKH